MWICILTANRYRSSINKQPEESEGDYLHRINQLENEKYSTVLFREKAILENVIKLKNKLKELIRNDADIENTTKDLSDGEIFLVLKFWELIKKEFLKIYGFNNKRIKLSEKADFIINILEDQNKQTYIYKVLGSRPEVDTGGALVVRPGDVVPEQTRLW